MRPPDRLHSQLWSFAYLAVRRVLSLLVLVLRRSESKEVEIVDLLNTPLDQPKWATDGFARIPAPQPPVTVITSGSRSPIDSIALGEVSRPRLCIAGPDDETQKMHKELTRRPPPRWILAGAGAMVGAIALTACGSTGAGATKPTMPTKTGVTTGRYLHLVGSGDRHSGLVVIAKKWTATWHFSCAGAATGKPFAIKAATLADTSHSIKVVSQNGLSGGGQKSYTGKGKYVFTVTTGCDWTLNVTRGLPPTTSTNTTGAVASSTALNH